MNRSKQRNRFAQTLIGIGFALAMSSALPAMADNLPQPVQQGKITYVTGGVGQDERQALEKTAKNYNLRITNADKKGKLTTQDHLVIRSSDGKTEITMSGTDPLFYAALPAGSYKIDATNGSQEQQRHIKIEHGKPVMIHFIWAD